MKRNLALLLGVMLLAAMPGKGLMAQTRTIDVTVATLDNAPVSSVTIYAGDLAADYYYDAAHLSNAYLGTPIAVGTLTSYSLIPDGNGHYLQNVDAGTYAVSLVAAEDVNGNVYVYGSHTSVERVMGIFHAGSLFDGVTDTLHLDLDVPGHMLMVLPATVAHDLNGARYTTMASALANAPLGTTVSIDEDLTIGEMLTLNRSLSVAQAGRTLTSALPVAVSVTSQLAAWNGNGGKVVSTNPAATFFKTTSEVFAVSDLEVDVAGTFVTASEDGSVLVGNNNVYTAAHVAYEMDATSTGTVTIEESEVLNNMANCNITVNADAYRNVGTMREYSRTITAAAANANAGETVYVGRKTAAGIVDTITKNLTLNLNGDTVLGTVVHASNQPLIVTNGVLNNLTGDSLHTGLIDVRMLLPTDSIGQLAPGTHVSIVENGRIKTIYPTTGANVSILAGKFGQRYKSYLAPRHSFVANDEADAASFPVKVVDGYTVTLVNYNAVGDTTSFVANTANNQIHPAAFPVLAAQDNVPVGSPYTFLYWANSADFSTPWIFSQMALSKDTTLYAKWAVYNPVTDIRVSKVDYVNELNGTYTRIDSLFVGVLAIGNNDTVIYASDYPGLKAAVPSYYHLEDVDHDTVLRFDYIRDTFQITWDLGGGSFVDGSPLTDSLVFGAPVVFPAIANVARPGFTCTGWTPSPAELATMPGNDVVVTALYDTIKYNLVWSGNGSSSVYNGQAVTSVSATYTDEHGVVQTPALEYFSVSDPGTALSAAVKAGTYIVKPVADGIHFYNEPASAMLYITRAPLIVLDGTVSVVEVKLYDGLSTAVVTNPGILATVYGSDDVQLTTIAVFDNPLEGTGKTITAYFTVTGNDLNNYNFTSVSTVVSTNGIIVKRPAVGTNGITVNTDGYCGGDSQATFDYVLAEGSANQYKLDYSAEAAAQGFADVDWTNIATTGQVNIPVPLNAEVGDYSVNLTLRNSAYPQFESAVIPVTFHVNLTKESIKPVFVDVISIVDTDPAHYIDQPRTKWYHMGVGATTWTYVGDGPYYKEPGGSLTGQYYAEVVFLDGTATKTCVQDDVTTLVEEADEPEIAVTAYPNPTVGEVNIRIDNATSTSHTLCVRNVMGVVMLQTLFDGDITTIDFNSFANGSYTVSVDGVVVRVIKK